ncbi:hypothetical protein CAEBREN_07214 [Caenorhabditis brenneri]|uniref:Uncharacterized protein n=1 Tax=Caenorhabditis brenneri TaxID=135651 RepID=G0MQJ4_CAEBE|nr:hypothetical protein CAEBREN_07214 [Caenorhabditis brenneri]
MRMLFGFICFGVIGSNKGTADSLCDITNLPVHCEFPAWKSTTKTSTNTATIISFTTTVPETKTQPLQTSTVTTSTTTVPPFASDLSEKTATSSSSVVETIMAVKEGMAHPLAIYGICGIVLACCVYLYVKSKKPPKQIEIDLTLLNDMRVVIRV